MANQPSSTSRSLVWPIAIGLVVILGVVAVVAARGDRTESSKVVDSRQTSEISVTGAAPLAPYDDTAATDPAVGATIPTVSGQDFAGDEVVIDPAGGARVLMFVAHWCPHCQAELPRIVEHLDDQPLPDGVSLDVISTSVKEEADNYPPESWIDEVGWAEPVLADSTTSAAATAFGLSSFPYFVAVDADGKVVERASGEITDEQLDALVDAAASGAA